METCRDGWNALDVFSRTHEELPYPSLGIQHKGKETFIHVSLVTWKLPVLSTGNLENTQMFIERDLIGCMDFPLDLFI